MSTHKNLITLCFAVVFALGLAACGGGGNGPTPMADNGDTDSDVSLVGRYIPSGFSLEPVDLPDGTTVSVANGESVDVPDLGTGKCISDDGCSATVVGGVLTIVGNIEIVSVDPALDDVSVAVLAEVFPVLADEPVLTELETAQDDAATAATDARTAATDAQTAATAADTARANRADIQTGDFQTGNSGELAMEAQGHADDADAAATAAEKASAAAAEATDVTSATRALVMAEDALDDAVEAQGLAEGKRDDAMTAAANEIKIVDKTTKIVDGTSITIDKKTQSETINDVTNITGLIKDMEITTMGAAIEGTAEVTADENANPPVEAADAIPGADVRDLPIGFTYDSADDDARVTLVHSYAGTKTVTAFADNTDADLTGAPGKIDHDNDGTQDSPTAQVALSEASGTFVLSTGGIEDNNNIAADAKPVTLYYYTTDAGMKEYVRVESSETSETTGAVTNTYQHVDLRAGAKIPEATEYSHLHFGVWSGLNGKDDGSNTVADIGLGFVANIGEMTSNMPNFGSASYEGNWVANVQANDDDGDGDFSRHDGVASMKADFGEGDVGVTLTGLASLEGKIDGNRFSGTEAALLNDANLQDEAADMLDAEAEFEGNFSGAFFGNLAAEAGGVFDFASDDGNNEGGAFRGAFGADQKPPAE